MSKKEILEERIQNLLKSLTEEEKYVAYKILNQCNFDNFILPELMEQYDKEHKDDDYD